MVTLKVVSFLRESGALCGRVQSNAAGSEPERQVPRPEVPMRPFPLCAWWFRLGNEAAQPTGVCTGNLGMFCDSGLVVYGQSMGAVLMPHSPCFTASLFFFKL